MQPAPSNTPHNIPTLQNTPDSPNHHHGQRRSDDLQDSLQSPPGEQRGAPGLPSSGDGRDATRPGATSGDGDATDVPRLNSTRAITPPPRDRITDYENARLKSPQKPAEGPLFEIVKSNRKPDEKKSPITDFPTGEWTADCYQRSDTDYVQSFWSTPSPIFRQTILPLCPSCRAASTI
jgi:hypothetical protein